MEGIQYHLHLNGLSIIQREVNMVNFLAFIRVNINKTIGYLLHVFRCSLADRYVQHLIQKQGITVDVPEEARKR